MLTFEEFKKSIEILLEFEEIQRKIDELTHKENSGFIDHYFKLTSQYVKLIEANFEEPESEWVSYWLYESDKDHKWVKIKGIEYDIADIKDLYLLLCKKYDEIKKWDKD